MEDIDHVTTNAVEDPKWITDNGSRADLRPLCDARGRERGSLNAFDDFDESPRNGFSDRGTRGGRVIAGYLA